MWWATDIPVRQRSPPGSYTPRAAPIACTRVDEGNTITDFDDEEIQRKITISTAIAVVEWKKTKINILDTPGFNIFINDARAALVAADAALVLVDGVAGVEVQTEKVWAFANDFELPRAIIINKLDRERSQLRTRPGKRSGQFRPHRHSDSATDRRRERFQRRGRSGPHEGIYLHARWRRQRQGRRDPRSVADAAQKAHEALVEMVAEGNDELMEEFFDKGTLPAEHIIDGLHAGHARAPHVPGAVRVGARTTSGTDLLLNFIVETSLRPPIANGH